MRLVAVTILLLAGAATMPVAPAANECQQDCHTVPAPATPVNARGTTYYLYLKALTCAPGDDYCQGQPAPRVTGFLYEEANKCGGLQRYNTLEECDYRADAMVLL